MSFLPKNILTAAAGIALAAGISSSAFAYNTTALTWDPGKTIPGLTGTSSPVTFDNILISDYATIALNNTTGAVTETAYLDVGSLSYNSHTVLSALNSANGFGMYFAVTATAQLNGSLTGAFTSLNYTLYGYSISNSTEQYSFASGTSNPSHTDPAGSTVIALATGSLINDSNNFAQIAGGVPNATADTNLTPSQAANASGFFVSPASNVNLLINSQFSNNQDVISSQTVGNITYFQIGNTGISGGSGHATAAILPVPEPASLAVLGMGLVGFGMFRRSRKQR